MATFALYMQRIIQFDKWLFHQVNSVYTSSFFDALAPFLRNSNTWIPFYLFLLLLVVFNFSNNRLRWFVAAAVMVACTNYISSDLIKENIYRLRPCNDPQLANNMRFLLDYRPISSSFTSSHAVNHFAMATYFYQTLQKHIGKMAFLFFLWAFIICYAQVYVGVHFPLDVFAGAIIGVIFGYLFAFALNKKFGLQ